MKLPQKRHYPKEIHFRGETYKIQFVSKLKDKRDMGECDPSDRVIRIVKNLSREETLRTLIHECLHILEFEYPINIKHRMIYKLEDAIYELLCANL